MRIRAEVKSNHLRHFPDEEEILKPFLPGFDVTWAQRRRAHRSDVSVFFLKPDTHTKEAFGFEQELLLAYSPYSNLQPRSIKAAEEILHDYPARGRVERLTYLLVSDMPGASQWVKNYVAMNQEARLIAAFSTHDLKAHRGDSWYVRNELSSQFFGRDLFDYRLPLEQDTYFFGREAEVLSYRDAIRRGENRGLFGLRKMGKTSLLFKVKRVASAEDLASIVYLDCKSPAVRTLRWHELIKSLSQKIQQDSRPKLGSDASKAEIADHFEETVYLATKEKRLVLVFDEIEFISPLAKLDPHWEADFTPFWQTIWSCQSRHRRLSVILAGVNPTVTEESMYNGVQNPLFGIVSSQYLKELSFEETNRMVRALGKRMGLKFNHEATTYLHNRYGGHPLLTRIACSSVNTSVSKIGSKKPVSVTLRFLKDDEIVRDTDLAFYCEHVVSELREFYPEEYEMLELLARKQVADFVELSKDGSWVKHLKDYGLVEERPSGPEVTIPVVERYVAGRYGGPQTIPKNSRSTWIERRIDNIIRDLRALERRIDQKQQPSLFGPNSFPEAERLKEIRVAENEQSFNNFINTANRCFVESIAQYGRHQGRTRYFWELNHSYPALLPALDRIKIYRHNSMHMKLNSSVEERYQRYLHEDLDGKKPCETKDGWFVLQERILDALFAGIQIETARL